MKTIVINQNQKGILFKNGKYRSMLDAGKYHLFCGREVEVLDVKQPVAPLKCDIETLINDPNSAHLFSVCTVGDEEIALHFVNGKFSSVLRTGTHVFFNINDTHEFKHVSIASPEVDECVPTYVFSRIPHTYYTKLEVAEYERALVYFDQRHVKTLDAGTYYFWKTPVKVDFTIVDTRLTQMDVTGQEILTADKVSLRVSLVCHYRIIDCIRINTEVENYKDQMHVAAQLAIRGYVGKYKLDEILENKEAMSEFVYQKLKEKEKDLYIEIADAGVKDIILPGEIRDIMNTVLVAEKKAQANVITRREEVASTRSLLNTARLMDENRTLYKLKELEYIERISENVGNISLTGSGDILSQLTAALNGKSE
jgi:regulator of protease activity HflC (stomatin/prohibitin superfamily)